MKLLVPSLLAISAVAFAQQGAPVAGYKLLNTISVPSGLAGNDISWVDSATARYYLADRGNATTTPPVPARIDVIDTENEKLLTTITLPNLANGMPNGSNGIVGIPRAHELWVGAEAF